MTEKQYLQIKKNLIAYAKKLNLGKAGTMRYVYGTLRKIKESASGKIVPVYKKSAKRCWKGYSPVKGKKPYSKGSCRKVQGNPARQADEAIARELYLFIENDEILLTRRYPQYILNLERKMKRGVYDREKAVKLFMYLADEASKRYSKQFGDGKTHTADVPTRMLLAKMLRDRFESERRAMGIPAGAMPRTNPSCGVTMNPVRTKTWKLGEYGGNIKANVNESGTAVQIIHSDKPLKVGAYGRLFRWPLDKFELEVMLNDLTTSYYASKIIEWVESVTKGTPQNPPLSSHGSSIITKRTHGLSLPEMRALYKLVKQDNDMAIAYARKKLEVPRSESKIQLLAVVDHHIRDLAGR